MVSVWSVDEWVSGVCEVVGSSGGQVRVVFANCFYPWSFFSQVRHASHFCLKFGHSIGPGK